jgi:hypothetical protein
MIFRFNISCTSLLATEQHLHTQQDPGFLRHLYTSVSLLTAFVVLPRKIDKRRLLHARQLLSHPAHCSPLLS